MLQNLKNCITNYLGFVLGGSGVAFVSFYWFNTNNLIYSEVTAFISLIVSVILSLVLSIIFYKFNSHNRYAGYCKLLNQERIELPNIETSNLIKDVEYDLVSWEICVNRLRYSDFEDEPFKNLYHNYKITDVITHEQREKISNYSGKKKGIDKYRFWKGTKLIVELILGRVNTKSWQFPLFVTGIFTTLTIIYLVISINLYANVYILDYKTPQIFLSNIAYFFLFSILIRVWITYIGKLHSLMEGSSTVDAYCWKFLPIRYGFLKYKFPGIRYSIITLTDYLIDNDKNI